MLYRFRSIFYLAKDVNLGGWVSDPTERNTWKFLPSGEKVELVRS